MPARCCKVLVVLPVVSNDVSRFNTNTRVITVDTPNDNAVSLSWGSYRTGVEAIEAATGYDCCRPCQRACSVTWRQRRLQSRRTESTLQVLPTGGAFSCLLLRQPHVNGRKPSAAPSC